MDKPLGVYDFPQVYDRLGMQLGHFGCIMLDVEAVPVTDILDRPDDWFYFSDRDELRYVKGPVAATTAHATLLYGLTPDDNAGIKQKTSVDELLDGLDLSSVIIDHIDSFPPQYNLPYACVVAKLKTDNDLGEANRRLRFLPHIDTFVEYVPHVTLAYVKKNELDYALETFTDELSGEKLSATGINYGGPIH